VSTDKSTSRYALPQSLWLRLPASYKSERRRHIFVSSVSHFIWGDFASNRSKGTSPMAKKVVPSFRRISGLARAGLAIFRDAGLAIDRDTREIAMAWSG
jgi:hypothetical protein